MSVPRCVRASPRVPQRALVLPPPPPPPPHTHTHTRPRPRQPQHLSCARRFLDRAHWLGRAPGRVRAPRRALATILWRVAAVGRRDVAGWPLPRVLAGVRAVRAWPRAAARALAGRAAWARGPGAPCAAARAGRAHARTACRRSARARERRRAEGSGHRRASCATRRRGDVPCARAGAACHTRVPTRRSCEPFPPSFPPSPSSHRQRGEH